MKPKQPNISDMYDRVEVYRPSAATRTSSGGFTESETLVATLWCNVTQKSFREAVVSTQDETGGRDGVVDYQVVTRKGGVEVGDKLVILGDSIAMRVVRVDPINRAFDKIEAKALE